MGFCGMVRRLRARYLALFFSLRPDLPRTLTARFLSLSLLHARALTRKLLTRRGLMRARSSTLPN